MVTYLEKFLDIDSKELW